MSLEKVVQNLGINYCFHPEKSLLNFDNSKFNFLSFFIFEILAVKKHCGRSGLLF